MACDDRQLSQAQREAGFENQRTGVVQAVRPFSGQATLPNLIDYLNREVYPALRATRQKVNDIYLQATDNAPSGNPLQFYFSTNTANADPTAGRIRLNAATQNTATTIRVSQTNARLADIAPWLDVMAGGATAPLGTVTLSDAKSPARFLRFDLNTMVDQGAYWDLGVTFIESSHDSPFVEDTPLTIGFIPAVAAAGATVPPAAITPIAANTVLANATGASAAPAAFPVGNDSVLGRVAGNIVAAQVVTSQVGDDQITNAKLANIASPRLKGRTTASTGDPEDLTLANSTSATWNTATGGAISVERAALTGAVTASANSNTTAFGAAAARTVLVNATNASAVPAFLAPTAGLQYLRSNTGNTALEWGAGPYVPTLVIPYTFVAGTSDVDPGNGLYALNNGFHTGATVVRLDDVDANGTNWRTVIGTFGGPSSTIKGYLRLVSATNPYNRVVYAVTAVAQPTGYSNLTVAYLAGSGFTGLTMVEFVSAGELTGTTWLQLVEQAASTPTVPAGGGMVWVRSDTPSVSMFTDDTNADHVLQYRGEGMLADGDKGDITVSASFATWTIDNDVVSDAKLRNSSALSVIGRSANSTGDPADISTTSGTAAVLRESGGVLGFGTVATAGIADDAITNAKLANMAAGRVKGVQVDGSTGDPQDLTGQEIGELSRRETFVTDSTSSGTSATYTVADITTQIVFKLSGAFTIQGMTATSATFGKTLEISFHAGFGGSVTLANESASAGSALQRIACPGNTDLILKAGETAILTYFDSRWRVMGVGKSVPRRLPLSPVYDVMDAPFNATGSLAGDDTAAINAAIAAANAAPGIIYLGPAHRITSALTTITGNNIVVMGRGAFNGGTILQIDSASNINAFTFTGQYCGLEKLWIVGNRVYTGGFAVKLQDTYRFKMQDVLISQVAFGVEILRCLLTEFERVFLNDLYGVYGFYAHGDGTAYCHATKFINCVAGTDYNSTVVGTAGIWASGQTISIGNIRFANGAIYQATTAGTTGATAPSGIPGATTATAHTATVSDGGVSWKFAMPLGAWFLQGSYSHTFEVFHCGTLQGGYGLSVEDDAPGSGSTPLFTRVFDFQVDHPFSRGVRLAAGAAGRMTDVFVTSVLEGAGIEIGSSYSGNWEIKGGEIFGCNQEGVLINHGDGVLADVQIGAVGSISSNTRDAIAVANSASRFSILGCSAGDMFGATTTSRYGLGIASGCDNYVVIGNRFIGNVTGAINNVPGVATTRVVRSNIPETTTGIVPDADYGDITVSISGTVWTIDNSVVTLAKMANLAAGTQIGRAIDAGTGVPQALTGVQQGQNLRRETVVTDSTSSGTSATYAIANTTTQVQFKLAGALTINGMTATSATFGKTVEFSFDQGFAGSVTWNNESGSAGAALERIRTPDGLALTITAGQCVTMTYFDSRWRVTGLGKLSRLPDADYGDVTVSSSGTVITIDNDVVTDAKLRNSAALSVIGRSANSTGDPADIVGTASSDAVLRVSGTTLGFGTVATAGLANNAVTNAKLAQMVQARVKGRTLTGGTGDPVDLTPAQVMDIIEPETAAWTAEHDFQHVLRASGQFSTTLAATANDLAIGNVTGLRISLTGNQTLTGMVPVGNGQLVFLENIDTTDTLTIAHNNAGSAVGNRFACPNNADLLLPPRGAVFCRYDANQTLWYLTGAGRIANAQLADMAQSTIKGRASGAGTGAPTDLTATQVNDIIESDLTGRALTFTNDVTVNPLIFNSRIRIQSTQTVSLSTTIYNDTDISLGSTTAVLRLDPSAHSAITGLVPGYNHRVLLLFNVSSSFNVTLKHEDTGSAAASRFIIMDDGTGTDGIHLRARGGSCMLWYDATSSRWRPLTVFNLINTIGGPF